MGRATINRVEKSTARRPVGPALVVAAGVVLLFALVGVVSAGSFVAGKVSGSSVKATATARPTTASSLVAQDIRRAQAQATAIVRQAQAAGHSIVAAANVKAHRQANSVLASARRRAAAYRPPASVPASIPTAVPNIIPPAGNAASNGTSFAAPTPVTSGGVAFNSGSTTSSGLVSGGVPASGTPAPVPNLGNLPATWLVVGYNASFGGSGGSVGTVSVVNRGRRTYSGVALVKYKSGGSASASFAGLAPGQALVLPLSGSPYPGGGYQIVMSGIH